MPTRGGSHGHRALGQEHRGRSRMGCWRSRVSAPPKSLGYSTPQLTELPGVRGLDTWTLPPLSRVRSELCQCIFR